MNGEIKIETGIPMPPGLGQRGRSRKYPWREMKVGDSFLVPGVTRQKWRSAPAGEKATGFKFATRAVEGGIRVWRVA